MAAYRWLLLFLGLVVSTEAIRNDNLFGVVQRIPALQIRGGQVNEPEDLSGVEALILEAGSNNKLVVVDFSATWCGVSNCS